MNFPTPTWFILRGKGYEQIRGVRRKFTGKWGGGHRTEISDPFDTQCQSPACDHVITTNRIKKALKSSYICEVTI